MIASCPVVLYTGSLVPKEVIAHARPDATVMDSSGMTLEQIVEVIVAARDADQDVARVHTGDPMIFGRGGEEMDELRKAEVPFDVIPGISAVQAAASKLKVSLTHRDHAKRLHFFLS